jgi:hypothetical protein
VFEIQILSSTSQCEPELKGIVGGGNTAINVGNVKREVPCSF